MENRQDRRLPASTSLALEEVARYHELAKAQLRCARWEMNKRHPRALPLYKAALEAVSTATVALPMDGTVVSEEHTHILQQLVSLRDDIITGTHEATRYLDRTSPDTD